MAQLSFILYLKSTFSLTVTTDDVLWLRLLMHFPYNGIFRDTLDLLSFGCRIMSQSRVVKTTPYSLVKDDLKEGWILHFTCLQELVLMGATLPDIRSVRDIEWYNLRRSCIKKFLDFKVRILSFHRSCEFVEPKWYIWTDVETLGDKTMNLLMREIIVECLKWLTSARLKNLFQGKGDDECH